MKPVALVLAVSLALNALIATVLARRSLARAAAGQATTDSSLSAPASTTTRSSNAAALTAQALLALDPTAMRAALARTDLPPEAIAALVKARIYARHDARRREFVRRVAQLPWWKNAAATIGAMGLFTGEERKELRELDAAARNEALRVLGPAALDRDGAIAARFGFVDHERAVRLDALLQDYTDLGAMLREEMHGLRTRADREREAFLETERQRDLAQLLTPQERELLELRTSPAIAILQPQLAAFEPTEQEYRALFGVLRAFEAEHPGSVTVEGQARSSYYREYPEVEDKIRATLGEPRYADWSLAGNAYTQVLFRLSSELGFTAAAVREAAGVLRDTAARSWAIGEDRSTTLDQKVADLKSLAAATRSTLAAQLGPVASAALQRETPWVETIANGYSVKIAGHGTSWLPVGSVQRAAPDPQRLRRPPAGTPPAPTNPVR